MKARNPLGKIPFLEHDDRLFFESEVICEYLEDCFPEKPLRPASPEDRAKARLITRTLDLYVMPPLHALTAWCGSMSPSIPSTASIGGARPAAA